MVRSAAVLLNPKDRQGRGWGKHHLLEQGAFIPLSTKELSLEAPHSHEFAGIYKMQSASQKKISSFSFTQLSTFMNILMINLL